MFDSLDDVSEFAGEDYEVAVVPRRREQSYPVSMNDLSIMKSELRGVRKASIIKTRRRFLLT